MEKQGRADDDRNRGIIMYYADILRKLNTGFLLQNLEVQR